MAFCKCIISIGSQSHSPLDVL